MTEASSPLSRIVVVLDQPQDVVNIAATVRAMKNMGLSRLRLVNPLDFDAHRIEGIAHRSADVVERAQIFDRLEEALADCVWVVGTTARARTANRNYVRPRAMAATVVERAADGPVALVFGREDRGLSNEALDLCHEVAVVPTDPDYSSLNLAQAALLLCYEIFLASGEGTAELPKGRRATVPATRADLETMYRALADGLARIDFFKGTRRDAAVLRTLRTILGRAALDRRESRLVGAIGFEIGHYLDRKVVAHSDTETGDAEPAPDG